jgi:maltose O-acetyltransferase
MTVGSNNRFEGSRCRSFKQIKIGHNNSFFGGGHMIWPINDGSRDIRIFIKNNSMFNRNLYIDACGYVEIGSGCMIGPDVYITDSNHRFELGVSSRELPMNAGKVIIGDNCWIGAKAIILKDVELGNNCIVAAGAVVTKSFPQGSIVGGVPAKVIDKL